MKFTVNCGVDCAPKPQFYPSRDDDHDRRLIRAYDDDQSQCIRMLYSMNFMMSCLRQHLPAFPTTWSASAWFEHVPCTFKKPVKSQQTHHQLAACAPQVSSSQHYLSPGPGTSWWKGHHTRGRISILSAAQLAAGRPPPHG